MAHASSPAHAWGRTLSFWTRLTLGWLMVITVTGAAVRLTGSGLGCTDWPTCSVNTELDAPAFHAAIEFGNRMISGLAIIPVIGAWIAARRAGITHLTPWLLAMVVGFIGQVLLGMLVTRSHLDPRVVLGHFLLSIVLIFVGVMLDHGARRRSGTLLARAPARTARFAWLATALTSIVITVGTLVTGSGPHTGSDESGDPIPRLGFDIREITRAHSLLVWLLGACLLWALVTSRSSDPAGARRVTVLIALGTAQGAIGYLQYFTSVPVVLVGIHIAGAVILWTAVVWHAAESTLRAPKTVSDPREMVAT